MEQLIREINSPANQGNSERIQEIQRQIQHLQREKAAWQLGLDFLASDDPNVKFYGALTIIVKINADWESDGIATDDGMKQYLAEALIANYVRLSLAGEASFVLQKLSSTLAVLYQRLAGSWLWPVRQVLASLVSQQFVDQSHLPAFDDILKVTQLSSTRLLTAAVRFTATLAEDLTGRTGRASGDLLNHLSASCSDSFNLLKLALSAAQGIPAGDGADSVDPTVARERLDLAEMSLQGIQSWHTLLSIHSIRASSEDTRSTTETVTDILATVLKLYDYEPLRVHVLQTLISVQHSAPKLLTKADPAFPQSFMKSDAVRHTIKSLTEGDFDFENSLLVDLLEAIMSQVDTTSSAYLKSERLADVLQALQLLLRCDGVAIVDDTVCQPVLEIVSQIVDGHTDWEEDRRNKFFHSYVQQACEACFAKARMPTEELSTSTRSWDSDERSKFSGFRFDIQDFLQACYGVLGPPLLAAVTQNLQDKTQPPDWAAYEVSVFGLDAFADGLGDDPKTFAPYVEATFDSQNFQAVLHSADVPDQVRKTSISLIWDSTSLLKQRSDLMQILNFLFASLHLPESAGHATQAIYTLCYDQRGSLTGALPGFMASLDTIRSIENSDRYRIYSGVAAIIQALPTEEGKVEPVTQFMQLLVSSAQSLGESAMDEESLVAQAADILQSMAAVGKGLRTPNDVPVDIDAGLPSNSSFWTTGPGSGLQQEVLALYQHVLNKTSDIRDSRLTEAASEFLRSGLTEEHPSPFKFATVTATKLVTEPITLDSANIDSVLGCASCLLASAKPDEMRPHLPTLLSPILSTVQQLLAEHQRGHSLGNSNFPSATLDFFSRLLPKWLNFLLDLDKGKEALALIIELALIVIADPDTLPRRSAASLFSALVEGSKPENTLSTTSRAGLNTLLQELSPQVVAQMLRLVAGDCARSELEVLSEPIRRYVQHQPMLFKNIGKEAMRQESGVLPEQALKTTTLEQRLRFIAQIDGLRGQRKTNELVKEFWISCRGAGFDYIA